MYNIGGQGLPMCTHTSLENISSYPPVLAELSSRFILAPHPHTNGKQPFLRLMKKRHAFPRRAADFSHFLRKSSVD